MPSSPVLAADVGASHAAGGEFVLSSAGELILRRFAFVNCTAAALPRQDEWVPGWAEALTRVSNALPSREAWRLTLPAAVSFLRVATLPALPRSRLARIVEFEAQQAMPANGRTHSTDYLVLTRRESEVVVLIGAAPVQILAHARAAAGDMTMARLEPTAVALYRCVKYNYPEFDHDGCVAAMADEEAVVVLRLMPGGLAVRTSAGLDLSGAAGVVERLHLEIARIMSVGDGGRQPSHILVAGALAAAPGVLDALASRLPARVDALDPLRRVHVSPEARAAGAEHRAAHLGPLVGMGVPALQEDAMDLSPAEWKRERRARGARPFLAAAVAASVAAMVLPGLHYQAAREAAEEALQQIDAVWRPLDEQHRRNLALSEQIEARAIEWNAWQQAEVQQQYWVRLLDDLQTRIGRIEHAWLERLEMRRQATGGTAPTYEAGSRATPAYLVLGGAMLNHPEKLADPDASTYESARTLLAGLAESPFIAGVAGERFDAAHSGVLRFEIILIPATGATP